MCVTLVIYGSGAPNVGYCETFSHWVELVLFFNVCFSVSPQKNMKMFEVFRISVICLSSSVVFGPDCCTLTGWVGPAQFELWFLLWSLFGSCSRFGFRLCWRRAVNNVHKAGGSRKKNIYSLSCCWCCHRRSREALGERQSCPMILMFHSETRHRCKPADTWLWSDWFCVVVGLTEPCWCMALVLMRTLLKLKLLFMLYDSKNTSNKNLYHPASPWW